MDDQPDYTRKSAQRGLGLQIAIAVLLGASSLFAFSLWRRKWPRLYAARTFRRPDLPALPNNLFGWMATVYKTSEAQLLEYAGLDAFVYLMFFKASFHLFWRLTLVSVVVIGPLRWYYTGRYEDDVGFLYSEKTMGGKGPALLGNFLWVYVVFSALFTFMCIKIFRQYTDKVVKVRQVYLGKQNSITDRTLRITGIPRSMRTPQALTEFVESLNLGDPQQVVLCHDWSKLDHLMSIRQDIICKLEGYWADFLGPTFVNKADDSNLPLVAHDTPEDIAERAERENRVRPSGRAGFLGLFGPKVDFIDYYNDKLQALDKIITANRNNTRVKVVPTAFMTMDSVATCQLAAQAVLSSKPHRIVTTLAPAPHDVIWRNVYISATAKMLRSYIITFAFILTTAFMVVPVSYLASFLDMDTIRKFMPWLADLLEKSPWTEAFVTQVLPTFVFTLFNVVVPYFYAWLSDHQGYISREDAELSAVGKNFFYVFVNLFLVFTIAKNYLSLLRDTTQIAVKLADALRKLSTFYTNLILLQGVGITPTRLLQVGSVLQFPFFVRQCKSPRDYLELYKPSTLNYGILLPSPLLIFIIVLMYSIMSGRILFFGALYFGVGYNVYKYQFLYSMVHPQHSTGRLWTLILRRVLFGILLFQLAMIGILVLESAYSLAVCILPLMGFVFGVWYDFEKFTEPLLRYIALEEAQHASELPSTPEEPYSDIPPLESDAGSRSVPQSAPQSVHQTVPRARVSEPSVTNSEVSESSGLLNQLRRRRSQTLDENRELHQRYANPSSIAHLEGPWIGVEGDECVIMNQNSTVRQLIPFDEWE